MLVALISRMAPSVMLSVAAFALLFAAAMRPAPVRAQEACEPGEAGACLPLPPCRMLPQPARPLDPDAPEPPVADARRCAAREAVAAVNLANDLYVRAAAGLDASLLVEVWADEALAEVSALVAGLRAFGRIATPRLLETTLLEAEVSADGERARVRTLEQWRYQERERDSRVLLGERVARWENEYTLARREGRWLVIANTVQERVGEDAGSEEP